MWPIRREIAHYEPWIRLDFLGFSRVKRDLSMGYERKNREKFFLSLSSLRSRSAGANATIWLAEGRIAHATSLP
jgi:hypothetical protein